MGLALGLGAALSWGFADYFAAVASRSVGALRVALGFHLVAMAPLTVLVLASGELARVSLGELAVFVGLGAVGWLSYITFYGALAIGPISVLSPIVSGYGAVTVVLAVLIIGERPSVGRVVAVLVTIAGVMVASANVREIRRATVQRRALLGFALALAAMGLLGGFVFGVSYYHHRIGWLGPIFLARGFAAVFLLVHVASAAWRKREAERFGPRTATTTSSAWPWRLRAIVLLLAFLDTAGYACFNVGVGHAATSVVATASAPYALVPIVMGVHLLDERPTRTQWAGVALVICGLILLGASS